MKKPLVSVIMPAFNAARYIEAAVNSVISQQYSNWELFIVDDASSDKTFQIIKTLSKTDSRITMLRNKENCGAGVSRNKGIKAAKGDYIAFLDADDLWKPKKLAIQLEVMQKQSAAVCFSSYEQIDEQGNSRHKLIEALPVLTYKKLLKSNYLGNLTGIYDVRKLGKIYAPSMIKRQDWALWLKAIKKAGSAIGVLQSLAEYRVRKGSISYNKFKMIGYNFSIYREFLNFGFLKSSWWLLIFLKEHFLVKSRQKNSV